jgi:hypothetical protein
VLPRSHDVGKLGEGCRKPMPRVDIQAQFVVASTEILDECVTGADHPCQTQPCQAAHRPQPGLQASIISLDAAIRVLLGDVARGEYQFLDHLGVGRCLVGGHLGRAQAVLEVLGEESVGGHQIPLQSNQHVDDLAVLIDCPVQVDPSAGRF